MASSIEIADDDLEAVTTLTTARGFLPKKGGGFLDTLTSDNMLRAMVSKTDRRTSWQPYQTVRYSESDWWHFTSVNYETPSGPRQAQSTVINTDVRCNYGICTHGETIGFELPEDLLEAFVASNVGKTDAVWRFRFNAKSGFHSLQAVSQRRLVHRVACQDHILGIDEDRTIEAELSNARLQ